MAQAANQVHSDDHQGNRAEAINHLIGDVGTALNVLTEAYDRLERETIERADLAAEVAAGQFRVYVYDRVAELKSFAGDLRETLEELRAKAPVALLDLADTAIVRMDALDELIARLEPQPSVLPDAAQSSALTRSR